MTMIALDSTAAIQARVREAAQRGTALRILGRGAWSDAGRPVRATETLSTDGVAGVIEYVPGDLVLTARAGTTLRDIREATAAHNQWLALDAYGGDLSTIGAIAATGSSGPLVTAFGRPRDLVLGVEFVSGTGAIARGGGRVVKNVAGFDLTRLLCGSWGTLGVITEVTVRVHARPERDLSLAIALDAASGPRRLQQLLRRLPFVPYACEVVNAPLAKQLIGEAQVAALVRLGGNTEAVAAQRDAFSELGDAREIDDGVWERLRTCEPVRANVFRLSRLPSEIERIWEIAHRLASDTDGVLVHATPARGVVRCIVPHAAANATTATRAALSAASAASRVPERLSPELWELVPPSRSDIAGRIKRAFDPHDILNPGILGVIA